MGVSSLTKVIFVRHGETLWNHIKRYQGHSDIALNATGVQQAELVARRLASENISAVYSSDLERAIQTGAIIGKKHSLRPISLPALREINFGLWEGLTYEEVMAVWPEVLSAIYTKPGVTMIPEGESFYNLQQRASSGLRRCIRNHPGETIVVVSHGGTMRVLLCEALGLGIENMWSLRQDHVAINIVEYFAENSVVSLVNDTCHIR